RKAVTPDGAGSRGFPLPHPRDSFPSRMAGPDGLASLRECDRMKAYLLSLGAGLLVGIVYSLLDVRSPAPPVVALIGLFGMLIGEQIMPIAKRVFAGDEVASFVRTG